MVFCRQTAYAISHAAPHNADTLNNKGLERNNCGVLRRIFVCLQGTARRAQSFYVSLAVMPKADEKTSKAS
jgi:hypothetical protein